MSKDSKRKKIKRYGEDETLEVTCEFAESKNMSAEFPSNVLLSIQCFEDFQVTCNTKTESDEFESDDSTKTVIRSEKNEKYSQNVYQNISSEKISRRISIKTEPTEVDISRNTCENINAIGDAIKEIDNFIKVSRYTSDFSGNLKRHTTEQINVSNTLSGVNCSDKIIQKKFVKDITFEGNVSPLKTCTIPNLTNSSSISHNKNVEQSNFSYLQSVNVESVDKGIKKESVSPDQNESSRHRHAISPKNIAKSSLLVVEDTKTCTCPHQTNTPECHTTEQENESKNLPVTKYSGKIIETKIKIEHASGSSTNTTLEENVCPLQTCISLTDTPNSNSLSHNKNVEQKYSSYLQSMNTENLEKTIKREPVSPERSESSWSRDVISPTNVRKSSPNFVEEMEYSAVTSIPSPKSSLLDPNRKFSTDCEQYLRLNVNFNLKDIKECINYIRTKYFSDANIGKNSSENIPCVSLTNLKKCDVSGSSNCNNLLSKTPVKAECLPDSFVNIQSTLENISKSIKVESIKNETFYNKNKIFSLDENEMQLVKPLSISENSTSLKDISNCVTDIECHHKNLMNFEQIQEKSSKSHEETSDKYIDKESSSSKFNIEKLDEILKKASSVFSSDPPPNDEFPIFTNDGHPVSAALQVEAVGTKRQASDVFDVCSFIDSKKLKLSLHSEHIGRKENPPLSQSARSADTKSCGYKKINHRNSSNSKESSVKRIKITDYQNKHQIQSSTFRQQNVAGICETSTRSLPNPYCPSFDLTTDRLNPYASSAFDGFKQNFDLSQNPPNNISSQGNEIFRVPRLRKRVSSIASSVKHADVLEPTPPSCAIGFKSRNMNQKFSRLDASISSSSYCHASVGSNRLHNSQSITGSGEVLTNKAIPAQDISFQIIGWKAKWLDQVNSEVIPSIFKEVQAVQDSYKNFEDFYGTFYGLHLISIWLDIYKSWKEQLYPRLSVNFESCEERTYYYKNLCSSTMDAAYMPINQGIIHITYNPENGVKQCLFGFVYDVQQRPSFNGDVSQKDVKFYFYTREKLRAKRKSALHIHKLYSLRVAITQLSSLESLRTSPIVDILLNPRKHEQEIKLFKIDSTVTPGTELQGIVNLIINSAASPNRFILVEQPTNANSLTILSLIRCFVAKRSTVLVCLHNTDSCFQIAQLLCYGFVLALKESELSNIPDNFKELTLRAEAAKKADELSLEAAELNILKNAKIILTVTSRIFLGDKNNATLGQKLTVIIERSTLCTELETAVPLSYKPENVVLLGCIKETMSLSSHLHLRDYNKSLFHRLYEA